MVINPAVASLAPSNCQSRRRVEGERAPGKTSISRFQRGQPSWRLNGEAPVNQNRAGHLLTLGAMEHAIETPEAPPSLIGRYSSGGAIYMIFDDGSIEAEMQEGTFKLASMADFKQYLADRNAKA